MLAHDNRSAKALVLRFDRVCGEINAFLLALAIGLAALVRPISSEQGMWTSSNACRS